MLYELYTSNQSYLGEAVRIRVRARQVGVTVLNNKLEYSRSELPKLVLEKGSKGGGLPSKPPYKARNVSSSQSLMTSVSNIVSENQENNSNNATFTSSINNTVGVVPETSCGNCENLKQNRSVKLRKNLIDRYKQKP